MAGQTHFARLLLPFRFVAREREELIHDYVVRIDTVLGKLLNESLRFVEREELGYAHANERGLFLQKHNKDASTTSAAQTSFAKRAKTVGAFDY